MYLSSMDTCSVRGDTVSQTNVLSFARINVIYLPELGGQLPPPDPPSRKPMSMSIVIIRAGTNTPSDEYDSYREYRVANTNMYSRIRFFLRGY